MGEVAREGEVVAEGDIVRTQEQTTAGLTSAQKEGLHGAVNDLHQAVNLGRRSEYALRFKDLHNLINQC